MCVAGWWAGASNTAAQGAGAKEEAGKPQGEARRSRRNDRVPLTHIHLRLCLCIFLLTKICVGAKSVEALSTAFSWEEPNLPGMELSTWCSGFQAAFQAGKLAALASYSSCLLMYTHGDPSAFLLHSQAEGGQMQMPGL